ncbi:MULTISPECIES: putative bifunctional diguanylate cyclase/phosphodiesterase [Ralstonia]|jgi:diguanylate cyclase|uniref:Signaling protein n=3 Tax=Pseudomonadota TaxID=1224 RepID=A0ABM9IR31_RALPI|nr:MULTISPECIES: bifunctional diguanylate cyclase/phosphodiesterase [Ralstonia]MBA4199590.1 bifunctional diguanylate cyclase/phosphodiesterase [Ralstonia sp.]MBA4230758.1 bifunctional diguanylate cyclase/phosphodiesterase [Ralstonia sp.]MBA4235461.1 bifunctional diguanylate cyclase/phosphodiesterase [Ralstonia sp.]MBA4278081.1 bifunctional diguanylate cyclase/phosphodiesterase [Ralstonia sp.]MBA4294651.1 bifunctional diguanylate cyclase/phosphodiesterase [Ralstonia sp.]
MLASSYNPLLVLLSLFVAILASYTALDMAGRVVTAQGQGRAALWWLIGGASAMGLGIWSMHFVGMLALNLPIPVGYDVDITLTSLAIGIGASIFALWLVSRRELPWPRLAGGAVLMGAGVAGMHYTGMVALRMNPGIQYDPARFVLSIVIAVLASGVALWMAFRLRQQSRRVRALRAGSAVVMGVAIVGMHYVGMAAAAFPYGSVCGAAHTGASAEWLALVIIIVTLAVLAIALIISVLDLRMEARTALLANSLAAANKELAYLALHDNLTKLSNRVLLEDRLTQAIRTADREKRRFAVMFMDLDGFKAVNDVYGHHVGDLLLIDVAQRIGARVRQQDTVARVGGDEFVVLAYVDDPEDAGTLADALLEVVREPFMAGGHELRVSTSIGIAVYPGDGGNQHDLLTNADAAMYHAKGLGRNAYSFFEPSMNADVHQQLQLVQDLRRAVERHELVLHYQPKFNAPNGPIMGVEALVRWQHPQRGLVPADEFIPLAEKTGLIVPLGAWVLDEACRQMAQWQREGHSGWSVAVNLSALQFGHAALIDTVRETLARHALDPRSLMLEITESTAMRDVDASLQILQQLDAMGVRISIDDFGTGYSSLLYLKRLPASELKIDRGFVRDLAHDTEDAAIVSAIVALGQTLNLRIVAEGVETAEQQAFLTRLGCHSLQGYLLGRPMTAESLSAAMA